MEGNDKEGDLDGSQSISFGTQLGIKLPDNQTDMVSLEAGNSKEGESKGSDLG